MESPEEPKMPFIHCRSLQCRGMEHQELTIEVLQMRGAQTITLTGMADPSLRESLEKIRCLLRQKKCWGPTSQLVVNLLPPEIPKVGAHLELALYTACLLALQPPDLQTETVKRKAQDLILASALTLNGKLLHTPYSERLLQERTDVVGADHFESLADFETYLLSPISAFPARITPRLPANFEGSISAVEVRGLELERFWITVAAVESQPLLLVGPPGAGKSHLARWSHTILPTLSDAEYLSCMSVWKSSDLELRGHRPFICPHSRTRFSDFLGTSVQNRQRPGLYALAHRGLLVLDEFNELNRDCRELLRTVLDEKRVLRHTRFGSMMWDAEFWLILTANPCECGFARGRDLSSCKCPPQSLKSYQSRMSGPLLDRMGLKRFVSSKTRADNEFTKLTEPIVQMSAEELRLKIPEWKRNVLEASDKTEASSRALIEAKAQSKRELENSLRTERTLRAMGVFSEQDCERLLWEKFEHERIYMNGAVDP